MLSAFHNGEEENLLFLPDHKMYLAIDYDGVNVYDQYENFYGHYPTEADVMEQIDRALIRQLNLMRAARNMVMEELENGSENTNLDTIEGFEHLWGIHTFKSGKILFATKEIPA